MSETTWWMIPSWESLMQRHEAATGDYSVDVNVRCAPGGNRGYEEMHARDGFDRIHRWVAEALVGAATLESCYTKTIRADLEFNSFPVHYAPWSDGGGRASRLAVCGAELKQRRRGRRGCGLDRAGGDRDTGFPQSGGPQMPLPSPALNAAIWPRR